MTAIRERLPSAPAASLMPPPTATALNVTAACRKSPHRSMAAASPGSMSRNALPATAGSRRSIPAPPFTATLPGTVGFTAHPATAALTPWCPHHSKPITIRPSSTRAKLSLSQTALPATAPLRAEAGATWVNTRKSTVVPIRSAPTAAISAIRRLIPPIPPAGPTRSSGKAARYRETRN